MPEKATSRHSNRRTVLKTLGATSAVSLASGLAGATRGNRSQGARGCSQGSCLHPFFGFVELPDAIDPAQQPREPDHTVTLHVEVPPEESCGSFMFDPAGLHVQPGDIVRFDPETDLQEGRIAGDHTVTAYHPVVSRQRRIPETATPFSSPMLGARASWLYQFETEGVYDVYCGPHEGIGMVMRIVVGDVTALDFGAPEQPGAIPPLGAAGTVLGAAALAPTTIKEKGSVPWSDDLCCG